MSDLVPFLKLLTKVGYPNPEIQTIARMADYNLEEFLPDLVAELGEEKADEFTERALNKMSTSDGIRIQDEDDPKQYAYIKLHNPRLDLENDETTVLCDWSWGDTNIFSKDDDGNDITTPQMIPHVLTDTQSNGDVITYNHEGTDYQATIVKEGDIKHMKSKVSDTVDAKNVYGVFIAYDEDGEGYNDFYVASVGSFVVRIKQGETIAKGDLLQSNGDGTAKVQSDDNVKSSSFAKVLSTTIIETYEDGSYLVPCSLMC